MGDDHSPANKAQWSFGQLLAWHLMRGTRPGGALEIGRRWSTGEFAHETRLNDRTIRYWLRDEHLPPETETIERILFKKDICYDEWRFELRATHARSLARKKSAHVPATPAESPAFQHAEPLISIDRGPEKVERASEVDRTTKAGISDLSYKTQQSKSGKTAVIVTTDLLAPKVYAGGTFVCPGVRRILGNDRFPLTISPRYEHTPIEIPDELRASYVPLIKSIRRGAKIWNGPSCRLLHCEESSTPNEDKRILTLHLAPVAWFDYAVLNGYGDRLLPSGQSIIKYFAPEQKVEENTSDFSWCRLSNLLSLALVPITSDGFGLFQLRDKRGVLSHGDRWTSGVAENMHRFWDEARSLNARHLPERRNRLLRMGERLDHRLTRRYCPTGTPHPLLTAQRGVHEELSEQLAADLPLDRYHFLSLGWASANALPFLVAVVNTGKSRLEIEDYMRNSPGIDHSEYKKISPIPLDVHSKEVAEVLANLEKWVPEGLASLISAINYHVRGFDTPTLWSLAPSGAGRSLAEIVADNKSRSAAPVPPPRSDTISNIPPGLVPRHFMGREDALAAIDAALQQNQGRTAIIAALHGLRGVGKTVLAAAYAEFHHSEYRAIWWLRAQTEAGLRADLVALGVRLGWVSPDETEQSALAVIPDRLRRTGEGILLLYDNAINVDTLERYLPSGGSARVLITSNAAAWRRVAEPVEIGVWPKEIGADYLIARTGYEGQRSAAEALSEVLGGLPLAHEQAAAYCERLGIALAEYRHRFQATPARMLDNERDAPAEYHDKWTVTRTFALAIDEAAKLHPAAAPLLVHAALLAPEPIPLFLFAEARECLPEPLASSLAGDGLDEAVAALRAFALIDREPVADERDPSIITDTIHLHRLVRQVAALRCSPEARDTACRALIEAVTTFYPDDLWRDPALWPRARRLDALALALVDHDCAPPSGSEISVVKLMRVLGDYRQYALAAYDRALPLFQRALAICETALGPEHLDTAANLNCLALLLQVQGDLDGAQSRLERALEIRERVLGPKHPDTAKNLNYLADLLQAQGDFTRAKRLHTWALAIRKTVLGSNHPDTATSLSALGGLLQVQGDLARAKRLHKRALAIRETVLGSNHPDTATSLSALGGLLQVQGDLAGAQRRLERALEIRERVLGPKHPDTRASVNNLAILLQLQGNCVAARSVVERTLAIREERST